MQKKKSTIFLKLLIVLVFIFMALAYYAYQLIQEDKAKSQDKSPTATVVLLPSVPTPMRHPALTSRDNNRTEVSKNMEIVEKNETEELSLETVTTEFIPPMDDVYVESSSPILEGVPKDEIYTSVESNTQEIVEQEPVYQQPIQSKESFSRIAIRGFLNKFAISLSTGSVASILYYYEPYVERYFLSNNVTHSDIRTEREGYNSRWQDRDFKIENFVILRMYKKDGIEYCKIASTIKWSVSTENRGADFGKSRGLMTLKKSLNGFKIVSIHSSK
ncbi:MAG: hypothetical protein KAG56_07490 [Sulfurovaceae bacterium]|nr:hypothetical protein [Sulfurovaceae bacterium]